MSWTIELLQEFERDIAELYNSGDIKAPIHLDGNNEQSLIDHFAQHFTPGDWVVCSWRSHYKALLAGVPPALLKSEIMAGRSITINLPDYRVLSSAIVAGQLPIALGIALGMKRKHAQERVHVFLGDMAAQTGTFHETFHYACNHDLPIHFVIENNERSVQTPTRPVWGLPQPSPYDDHTTFRWDSGGVHYFTYTPIYPHSGAGKWINW